MSSTVKQEKEKTNSPSVTTPVIVSPYINVASLFDYFNYSVVAAFFSSFFFSIIVGFGHQLEITIILIELFVAFVMMDPLLRNLMVRIWTVNENQRWHETLIGMMNFLTWLLRFLLFQFILSALNDAWLQGDLNYSESTVAVFSLTLLSVAGVHCIKVVFG